MSITNMFTPFVTYLLLWILIKVHFSSCSDTSISLKEEEMQNVEDNLQNPTISEPRSAQMHFTGSHRRIYPTLHHYYGGNRGLVALHHTGLPHGSIYHDGFHHGGSKVLMYHGNGLNSVYHGHHGYSGHPVLGLYGRQADDDDDSRNNVNTPVYIPQPGSYSVHQNFFQDPSSPLNQSSNHGSYMAAIPNLERSVDMFGNTFRGPTFGIRPNPASLGIYTNTYGSNLGLHALPPVNNYYAQNSHDGFGATGYNFEPNKNLHVTGIHKDISIVHEAIPQYQHPIGHFQNDFFEQNSEIHKDLSVGGIGTGLSGQHSIIHETSSQHQNPMGNVQNSYYEQNSEIHKDLSMSGIGTGHHEIGLSGHHGLGGLSIHRGILPSHHSTFQLGGSIEGSLTHGRESNRGEQSDIKQDIYKNESSNTQNDLSNNTVNNEKNSPLLNILGERDSVKLDQQVTDKITHNSSELFSGLNSPKYSDNEKLYRPIPEGKEESFLVPLGNINSIMGNNLIFSERKNHGIKEKSEVYEPEANNNIPIAHTNDAKNVSDNIYNHRKLSDSRMESDRIAQTKQGFMYGQNISPGPVLSLYRTNFGNNLVLHPRYSGTGSLYEDSDGGLHIDLLNGGTAVSLPGNVVQAEVDNQIYDQNPVLGTESSISFIPNPSLQEIALAKQNPYYRVYLLPTMESGTMLDASFGKQSPVSIQGPYSMYNKLFDVRMGLIGYGSNDKEYGKLLSGNDYQKYNYNSDCGLAPFPYQVYSHGNGRSYNIP